MHTHEFLLVSPFIAVLSLSTSCFAYSNHWGELKASSAGQAGTDRALQQVHIWGSGKVQVGKSRECRRLSAGSDLHCVESKPTAATFQHSVHHTICQPETTYVGRGGLLFHKPREL